MAGWISSKLKVAENFLQQIDQQAAESLGKQEKQRFEVLNSGIPKQSETASSQDRPKKKLHEIPDLLNRPQTVSQAEKHPRAHNLQGLRKSVAVSSLQQEVTNQEGLVKSPVVARPLPVLRNDDWTELLASPGLISGGSSLGSGDYAGNGIASGKALRLGGKDVHSNGVSNASKNGPSVLSSSKIPRSPSRVDASTALRSHKSEKNVRRDNKLRQQLEHDPRKRVDAYRDVFPVVNDVSSGTERQTVESDTVPDGSSSVQGSESDSSSAESSIRRQEALENIHTKGDGDFQAGEDLVQRNKGSLFSDSNMSILNVNENSEGTPHSLEPLGKAPLDIAVNSHSNPLEETIIASNKANPYTEHEGQCEMQGLQASGTIIAQEDVVSNRTSRYEDHQPKMDSKGTSIKAAKKEVTNMSRDGGHDECVRNGEQIRFVAGLTVSQVDGVHRNSKPGKETYESHGSCSESDERTETDTDSASGTDSEDEDDESHKQAQRKKKEELMAAEAAAIEAAKAAVKEREEFVMKLEREKENLEHILAEREEQQAREAAELQMNMTEAMQAVDIEKQKHNNTRMEALARVAKLETENAELAKLLASVQRNLELQLGAVAEIRQRIESKQVAKAEIERRLFSIHHKLSSSAQLEDLRLVGFEHEIFEEEDSHVCEKIEQLQAKVKQLEENIGRASGAWQGPSEVEFELESRLSQLTDHLIQKQAQVEALSAEKASLLFRLEAVSNIPSEERLLSKGNGPTVLSDSVSMDDDLEFGLIRPYDSRTKAIHNELAGLGGHSILVVLRQLDAIFSAGAYYLRRHGMAQYCALAYLVALHIWVIFVLFSHSREAEDIKSGALFSLESINNATNASNSTHSQS